MGFLSSLFQTGTPVPQVAGPAIATSKLPEELAPYYKDIMGKAQALYNDRTAEGYKPYTGPTMADFTPEQQQAFTGIAGLQGSQAPVFDEAMNLTRSAATPMTQDQMTSYMSPYQQAVTDIEKREATKQYEGQVQPALAAQAAATGGFGGSRQAILEGMASDTQQRLLGDIQAKGSQQGYQDAVSRFNVDRQAQGQAGAQLAQMAPNQFKAQLGELGAIQTVGEQKQKQSQTALDEAFRQYQLERDDPYNTMSKYQSVIQGAPMQQTTFANPAPPTPSTAQTLLGGLGTLVGTYGAFGGNLNVFGNKKKHGGMVYAEGGGGLNSLPVVYAGDGTEDKTLWGNIKDKAGDFWEWNKKYTPDLKVITDKDRYLEWLSKKMQGDPASKFTKHPIEMMGKYQGTGARLYDRSPTTIGNLRGKEILNTSGGPVTYEQGQLGKIAKEQIDGKGLGYGETKARELTADEYNAMMVQKKRDASKPKERTSVSGPKQGPLTITQFNQKRMADKQKAIPFDPLEDSYKNALSSGIAMEGLDKKILATDRANEDETIKAAQDKYLKAVGARQGKLDERASGLADQKNQEQWANVASFFARLGSASPRKGGIMGVLDVALQEAPESIAAMGRTNARIKDKREAIEDKKLDLDTILRKEELGMTLSKVERKTKRRLEDQDIADKKKLYDLEDKKLLLEAKIAGQVNDVKPADMTGLSNRIDAMLGATVGDKGRMIKGKMIKGEDQYKINDIQKDAARLIQLMGVQAYYTQPSGHQSITDRIKTLLDGGSGVNNSDNTTDNEQDQTTVTR
jgi:hypothetical protein